MPGGWRAQGGEPGGWERDGGGGLGGPRSCAVLWRPLLVRAAHRGGGCGGSARSPRCREFAGAQQRCDAYRKMRVLPGDLPPQTLPRGAPEPGRWSCPGWWCPGALSAPPTRAGTAPSPRDSGSGQLGDAVEQEPIKGRALDLACIPHTVTETQAVLWCLQGAELAAASAKQPPARRVPLVVHHPIPLRNKARGRTLARLLTGTCTALPWAAAPKPDLRAPCARVGAASGSALLLGMGTMLGVGGMLWHRTQCGDGTGAPSPGVSQQLITIGTY